MIQQYMGMLLCLLNSLNRIWIQMEWNCKYVRTMSGLSNLFSDGQFLKMSYHVVKFCEEKLMNGINEYGACDVFSTALLELIIPLFLRLLRCIHVLWTAEIGVDLLPAEVEKAKTLSCMELDHLLEISDGLYTIDSEESFRENETRALLEGT
uniref:Exportin-5 C-terminal domain-containing protein n=1 Tax=Aegilops tauschii subsp. strangulata TaxID=200361 RepID=A0A453NM97_AEGTS